jgi:DNA-binding NarL/FixJ family response regulator
LSPTLVRILVVEDFIPFRSFLTSLLQQRLEWQVVAEALDGLEAVQKAKELSPDLILLDIGLPNLNGIEAARQIREIAPKSRILFVSQESSTDVVQEALALGAHGYVLKLNAASELSAAVESVLKGKRFVSSGLNGLGSSGAEDLDKI